MGTKSGHLRWVVHMRNDRWRNLMLAWRMQPLRVKKAGRLLIYTWYMWISTITHCVSAFKVSIIGIMTYIHGRYV